MFHIQNLTAFAHMRIALRPVCDPICSQTEKQQMNSLNMKVCQSIFMLFVILSVLKKKKIISDSVCFMCSYLHKLGEINLVLTPAPLLDEFDPGGNDLGNDSKVIESTGRL